MISGKMEITIKIKDMPDAQTTANNWKQFDIDCDNKLRNVACCNCRDLWNTTL